MYSSPSSCPPYRLSRDAETEELQLSCSGLALPHKPVGRVSPLLPLTKPQAPLQTTTRRRPPLSGQRLPLYSLNHLGPLNSNKRNFFDHHLLPKASHSNVQQDVARSEAVPDLVENYGRESQYSGSCVQIIQDLIVFTGNDGKLRVSRLEDSDSPLFSRLPGPSVNISDPALTSSRIFSLHPRVCSDGSVAVLARYRQGVALFSVQETEEEREGPGWVRSLSPSLPVSGGLASVCWTNTRQVATVSCGGELAVWDPATALPTGRHSLPGGELQQGWASCGPGYHPASLLVTDRLAANILDTRSGSWTSLGLSPAGQTDPVRHLDCEGPPPYCYLLTDTRLLLSDLRLQTGPPPCRGFASAYTRNFPCMEANYPNYVIKNQRGASCVTKPLVGGSGCDELVLYGIREPAPATLSTNESQASTFLDQ